MNQFDARNRQKKGMPPRQSMPHTNSIDYTKTSKYSAKKEVGKFVKAALPTSLTYYESQSIKLKGKGAWRDAICPFHPDSNPSLRVRVETGAFRCMVCDTKGGDVLAFHRQLHNMNFVNAAKALGAWEAYHG